MGKCDGFESWTEGECSNNACDFCSDAYAPVCVEGDMLFQNECWATCEGFDTWTEGECSNQAKDAISANGGARKDKRRGKKQRGQKKRSDNKTPQKNGEG